MWSDLRLAARSLARTPLFTFGVLFLLIAGVTACATMFSLADALLLRPLPVREPGQLVRPVMLRPPLPPMGEFYYEEYDAWRKSVSAFEDVIAWAEHDLFVRAGASTERARVHFVSGNYFAALGTTATIGRLLSAHDGPTTSGLAPAVLSHAYWRRRFAADPDILHRTIEVNGVKVTIVGVTAKGFNGLTVETGPDVRVPLDWLRALRPDIRADSVSCEVAARVKPGVSFAAAHQEAEVAWQSTWRALNPSDPPPPGRFELQSAARGISRMRAQFGGIVWLLMGSVMLLLSMVCANIAGLMSARAGARGAELGVRSALGAGRFRLVRQLFCESLLLIAMGTAGAMALSIAAIPFIARMLPPVRDLRATRLPLALDLTLDWRVFAFTIAVSASAVMIFGLLPAITAAKQDLHPFLKEARTTGRGRGRQALIVLQAALSTVLLVGAGLTTLTLHRLERQDAGFDRNRIITFSLDTAMAKYTAENGAALQQRLLDEARTLPGVESAAIAGRGLMRGTGLKMTVVRAGQSAAPEDFMNSSTHAVSPEYFATMGIPLRAGRGFSARERSTAPKPVVVNETFAKRFGGESAVLGARFGPALVKADPAPPEFEVVGIAGDAKYRSLREPFQPTVYGTPAPSDSFILHVRTRSAPEMVISPMRGILARIDSRLSWVEVNTLEDEVAASLWPERAAASLASMLAALGALIVATGLYALVAFSVVQRRREIAIRMAVGAAPRSVVGLMFWRTVLLAIAGAGIGLLVARIAASRISAILYLVEPGEPAVMISVAAAILVIAAAAAIIPSSRAVRIDPASVLRAE